MITTDHNKIYYRPFRKEFYIPVPEINQMTDAGQSIAITMFMLVT